MRRRAPEIYQRKSRYSGKGWDNKRPAPHNEVPRSPDNTGIRIPPVKLEAQSICGRAREEYVQGGSDYSKFVGRISAIPHRGSQLVKKRKLHKTVL